MKRIVTMQDLSCIGKCSLTVALPVLSAMGCQCCPLPTALLSAHTGFSGNTFLDLTVEMGRIADHWAAMDLQFDAIYSGFLGSADQVDTVARFFDTFKKSGTAVIVDPVMGDHGTAYRTCTPDLCRGMRALAENADVITPNLTEAALLLDRPYEEIRQADAYEVVRRLSLGGRRSVVLTGYFSEPCALTVTAARAKLYKLPGSRRTFLAPVTCLPASSLEGRQGVFPFFRPPKPPRILSVIALHAPWPRDSQSRMA